MKASIRQRSAALSFFLTVLVVAGGAVTAQTEIPEYRIIDLGTFGSPDSETYSTAYGINERGDVVGNAEDDDYRPHAFVYHHGELIDVGTFEPDYISGAGWDVNAAGQVAGRSIGWSPYWKFPTWVNRPFVGTAEGDPLDPASGIGIDGEVFGINDGGQMAVTLTRVPEYRMLTRAHFYDPDTGLRAIEFPPQPEGVEIDSAAWAINQRGQVAGAFIGAELAPHAYTWDPETNEVVDLHVAFGLASGVYGLNDAGDAAGWLTDPVGNDRTVVWTHDGRILTVPSVLDPVLTSAVAEEINNPGDVVGWASTSQGLDPQAWVAFDAVDGFPEQIALDDLLNEADRAGWELWFANAINDARQIVGIGLHNGLLRGFLMTPVCVDIEAPVVEFLDQPRPPDGLVELPMSLGFDLVFRSSDEYYGGIVHEAILIDGCTAYDGDTYGDGDGLLSDEELEISARELRRVVDECGFQTLQIPEIRVQVTDCGGSVASDVLTLPINVRLADTDGDGVGDALEPLDGRPFHSPTWDF